MELLYKIRCKLNLHTWIDRPISGIRKNPDDSCNYYYRSCSYCGKLQYKKRNGKWENATVLYETNTQIVYKTAEGLAKSAAELSNELSKFDNHKDQKTRVFMNLLYIARALSDEPEVLFRGHTLRQSSVSTNVRKQHRHSSIILIS